MNTCVFQQDQDLKHTVAAMTGDGLPPGEIQILHATPEQISQLQQAHHIQILQGDQVIQMPVGVPVNKHFLVSLSVSPLSLSLMVLYFFDLKKKNQNNFTSVLTSTHVKV